MTSRFSILFLAVLLSGCQQAAVPTPAAPQTPAAGGGFQGSEQTRWHHLAEGSELYPLAWLLALEDADSGKPFLDNPERFGLIAEPQQSEDNPYGLPIGLTVDQTRDLRFAGVQMVGVNCAACHVNELQAQGQRVALIDGAPNQFDLTKFYGALAQATLATFTDLDKAWRFVVRLFRLQLTPNRPEFAMLAPRDAAPVLTAFGDLATLRQIDKTLADRLDAIYKEELAKPPLDLNRELRVRSTEAPLAAHVKTLKTKKPLVNMEIAESVRKSAAELRRQALGRIDLGDVKDLAEKAGRPNSPLARLDIATRTLALTDALRHFGETLRLLKARAAFLVGLVDTRQVAHTEPGFGRVDAFGAARNLVFRQNPGPLTAPISYPHLWNLKQIVWFHWDANTTSLLERNVGQALGLGALFDPTTFDSTVLVPHIEELELLAGKIPPPFWPAAAFGKIDDTKSQRGAKLYATYCVKCHKPLTADGNMGDDRMDVKLIGTDPLRAENFVRPVGMEPFNDALSRVLKAVPRRRAARSDPRTNGG